MLEYSLILHARLHTLGYIWYEDKRGDILIMILSYISIFLTIPMRVFLVLFLLFFFNYRGVSGPACGHHDYSPRPTEHPASTMSM